MLKNETIKEKFRKSSNFFIQNYCSKAFKIQFVIFSFSCSMINLRAFVGKKWLKQKQILFHLTTNFLWKIKFQLENNYAMLSFNYNLKNCLNLVNFFNESERRGGKSCLFFVHSSLELFVLKSRTFKLFRELSIVMWRNCCHNLLTALDNLHALYYLCVLASFHDSIYYRFCIKLIFK